MGLLDTAKTWLTAKDQNTRALTYAQIFGHDLDEYYSGQTTSGVPVTHKTVMQAAVGACIRLLADDISSLPIDTFRRRGEDRIPIDPPDWLVRPSGSRFDTAGAFISDLVVSLGVGHAFILGSPDTLDVEQVRVLDPDSVAIREVDGRVTYETPNGTFDDRRIVSIPWIRLPGQLRGIDAVEASKETSGLELAAREWASRFFGNGATVGGVIEIPPGPKLDKEQMDTLRKEFAVKHQGRRRSWNFGILTGGAKLNTTSLRPNEAELAPLWKHVLEEAARIYHIPPHLLGSQDPGGSSFSSVEQRSIEYAMHGVTPFVRRIEAALSRLLPGDDTFVRLNMNGLMRGDVKTRGEFYQIMTSIKAMKPSLVAALEDLPPDQAIEGWLETPNNNGPEAAAPAPAASSGDRGEPVSLTVQDAPITVHAAPLEVHAAPMAVESHAHIDSVQLSDEAARGITDRVVEHATEMTERTAADIGQVQTDLLQRQEAVEARLLAQQAAAEERLNARLDAIEAKRDAPPKPVTKQVVRDDSGRITGVIERQGDRMLRKVVERDENGVVLRIVEVAA